MLCKKCHDSEFKRGGEFKILTEHVCHTLKDWEERRKEKNDVHMNPCIGGKKTYRFAENVTINKKEKFRSYCKQIRVSAEDVMSGNRWTKDVRFHLAL